MVPPGLLPYLGLIFIDHSSVDLMTLGFLVLSKRLSELEHKSLGSSSLRGGKLSLVAGILVGVRLRSVTSVGSAAGEGPPA